MKLYLLLLVVTFGNFLWNQQVIQLLLAFPFAIYVVIFTDFMCSTWEYLVLYECLKYVRCHLKQFHTLKERRTGVLNFHKMPHHNNVVGFSEIALSCHGFVALVHWAFGPLSSWGIFWTQCNIMPRLDSPLHSSCMGHSSSHELLS